VKPDAGYSGTPLAKKLGIKERTVLCLLHAPDGYARTLAPLPPAVELGTRASASTDIVQLFATKRAALEKEIASLRKRLRSDATLWVSWPKRASGVPTDITEDVIREIALPIGLVDVKVCAVDETWSGLKLVVRKALR
jgi:hypothetical protein